MITSFALPDGGSRNLSIIEWTVVFLQVYTKSRMLSKSDSLIPKPLCPEAGRLLLLYLTLVQPVLSALVPERFGKNSQKEQVLYDTYLFVVDGKLCKAEWVYSALHKMTMQYLGYKISISYLRHFLKVIFRDFMAKDELTTAMVDGGAEDDEAEPINAIFGHSDHIAETTYAVKDTAAATLDYTHFKRMLKVGRQSHVYWGIGKPMVTITDGRVECSPSVSVARSEFVHVSVSIH